MTDPNSSRIEALRRARQRRPWTDDAIVESASNPREFKERLSICTTCAEPCEEPEVCATAVATSQGLLDSMGREQAFHLIENGMRRLRSRDEADYRTADRERPNTFLQLAETDDDATEPSDD